ncbi:hypothetical protein [Lactobacillus johnsonii]|uniref:Uncharacterized protein n=1 Tax=Lactobacillus johnsonii (strain CNCM I-12250 / La1 / NCC 533) TaxID=257314 RepID=Q74JQ5_LACJO|nr:hypothetical protein [Lactobacillus johnsonii]AAS08874.1 hypothetical protein LJ_1053 [Lactobacillus johnsonii NCC 533]MCT3321781.1 hypothetical protein [Lactobacillus johnsonii]MCT3340727.1 hypothetical protein [Lactobacillus johnsonii]MCT3389406.1 hypothetical protein [Lactobacillus johnsonii]
MTDLGFTDDMAQQFVNGAMKGFTDYVRRRKEDADKLIVSRGATWMKGNYIDDGVAKELANTGVEYQRKMAGYSWEYLQFNFFDNQSGINNSLIFKNYRTLTSGMRSKSNKLPDYLAKDALVNVDILRKNKEKIHKKGESIQLELLPLAPDYSEQVETQVNGIQSRFYVVGYQLGNDGNLDTLNLLMPNPSTNSLVEIENWNKYIVDAPIQPQMEDLSIFQNEKDIPEGQYDDTSNMRYEIADNNKEKES